MKDLEARRKELEEKRKQLRDFKNSAKLATPSAPLEPPITRSVDIINRTRVLRDIPEALTSDVNTKNLQSECPVEINHPPIPKEQLDVSAQTELLQDNDNNQETPNISAIQEQNYIPDAIGVEPTEEELIPRPEMKEEDIESIVNSEDFKDCFLKASKLIEKVWTAKGEEGYDIFKDLSTTQAAYKSDFFKVRSKFSLDDSITGRSLVWGVTDMCWSNAESDRSLIAVSYQLADPEYNFYAVPKGNGLICIWSNHLVTRPEHILHCYTHIQSIVFDKYQPSIVYAGTRLGDIVIWDIRKGPNPIIKTDMTNGHTGAVICLKMSGDISLPTLISASTSGEIKLWNTTAMTTPLESFNIVDNKVTLLCTSFAFMNDFKSVIIGVEPNIIYHVSLVKSNSQEENKILHKYISHYASITSVDISPVDNSKFLSASFDWDVKLWEINNEQKFLNYQGSQNIIVSVKWSPKNPNLFASLTNNGELCLYNITKGESPISKIDINQGDNISYNKMEWNYDGSYIVVGDLKGTIQTFEIILGKEEEERLQSSPPDTSKGGLTASV